MASKQPEDIVPEDFDLHSALHSNTTTDDREKKRCPECLSSCIAPHSNKWAQSEDDYRCEECRHTFSDPVTGLTTQEVRER